MSAQLYEKVHEVWKDRPDKSTPCKGADLMHFEQGIYDNSANIINVEERVEEVFQSVSNGKELIASAITDKGVDTGATDTFATMAQNISDIPTGGEGIPYLGEYEVIPSTEEQTLATKNKTMSENVTIKQIPTYEVSNESGTTFIIGGNL